MRTSMGVWEYGSVGVNKKLYFYSIVQRMRLIVVCIFTSMFCLSSKAQTLLPYASLNYMQWAPFPAYNMLNDSAHLNQKWSFNTYGAISAGYGYFNGVGGTILSAPVGIQLNRQLNNNLYAFAGVSTAPALFNFSSSFMNPSLNKTYPGSMTNAYGFGMNTSVQLGLMYVNDAKTFSISGSIGIERSSYPVYQPNGVNTKKSNVQP
jgi:hypothetical protein